MFPCPRPWKKSDQKKDKLNNENKKPMYRGIVFI